MKTEARKEHETAVLGFDARKSPNTLESFWPSDRRAEYLIQKGSPFVLSVDSLVWPSLFDTGEGIGLDSEDREQFGLSGIELPSSRLNQNKLLSRLQDLNRLLEENSASIPQDPWIIAVTGPPRQPDDAVPEHQDECDPGAVAADWVFLGYDVVSEFENISAVSNCGHNDDDYWESSGLESKLNPYHLFSEMDDAREAKIIADQNIVGHSPFIIVGLWRVLRPTRKKSNLPALWAIVIGVSLLSGLANFYAMKADVSPSGGPDPFAVQMFLVLPMLGTMLVVIPIGLLRILLPKKRAVGLLLFVGGLIYVNANFLSLKISRDSRMEAFRELGVRLEPLVDAIEEYQVEHGSFPETIEELVPKYLDELPATGMGNHEEYHYFIPENAKWFAGNPWVITMRAGYGLSFDEFMYFPLQNYADSRYGSSLEQLGEWAYRHE